ncbi:hypothetical protein MKW94_022639 [Papaver nudicaule]|uniref:Cyclin C-terminal domain-containing protein n=1 Tax=Papaver nudicaule TaxID=74823 RepID=A0AA41SFB2_PAPNU|nr:hypothetical protein [Papaver nudicaule]
MVKENMLPSILEECTTQMTKSRAAGCSQSCIYWFKLSNKRSAVFKDSTNALCDTSYRNCIHASKFQTKTKIQARRVPAPGVSLKVLQDQEDSRKDMVLKKKQQNLALMHKEVCFRRNLNKVKKCSKLIFVLKNRYLKNRYNNILLPSFWNVNFLVVLYKSASAVFLAQWTLDHLSYPWNPTLEHYTNYKVPDMKITGLTLQDLQVNTSSCPSNAIREKSKNQNYKSVATWSSPKHFTSSFKDFVADFSFSH